MLQSALSKIDTFGDGTQCPSYRDVRLVKSQLNIKGKRKKGINSSSPSYRDVRMLGESRLYNSLYNPQPQAPILFKGC